MKLSYAWLRERVGTTCTPEELADRLRVSTCEVEEIVSWGKGFDGIVIGKVLDAWQHPNADRLRVAEVSLGETKATIVCGAPNLAVGQTVAVATPGATVLPLKGGEGPLTISVTKLRGVVSEGMLCGPEELGLTLPADGILVLPDGLTPGTPFAAATGLDDTVLDLEVTPNRPDLLSYAGIAREVAALEKKRLTEPPIAQFTHDGEAAVSVSIDDARLSRRLSALCLERLPRGASPLWMQVRLMLSGIRPVSALVDVTNYVMLELGQPLHAFDADVVGSSLRVRGARKGEKLRTLDGADRVLAHDDIVIAGADNKPADIAGIMGGRHSGVGEGTTRAILTAAHFDGASVRRASRTLGLRSEASTRFEKGLDPEGTVPALKRAAYLLQEMGATVVGPLADAYPEGRQERPRIHLSFARIQQVLGLHLSAPECKGILQHLGFQVPAITKSSLDVVPPSWRLDVTIPEDVIEELIRVWGFERLPATLPSGAPAAPLPNPHFQAKRATWRTLAGLGYRETVHLSFASRRQIELAGFAPEACIRLPNPLSEDNSYLIPSHLVPFLANCGGPNADQPELKLFEVGRVFAAPTAQAERLSLLLRSAGPAEDLYRQAKADISRLIFALQRSNAGVSYGGHGDIMIGDARIGTLRLVPAEAVRSFKIKRGTNLLFIDIDFGALTGITPAPAPYRPTSPFPGSRRDITAIVPLALPVGEITALLERETDTGLVDSWQVGDIFTGKPLDADTKSVHLRFDYNARVRTLTDEEIKADQDRLSKLLVDKVGARIS